MLDFFYGWRRKMGCVTLVMACVVMGMWLRSLVIGDELCFLKLRSYSRLISADGRIGWREFEFRGEQVPDSFFWNGRNGYRRFPLDPDDKTSEWLILPDDLTWTGWDTKCADIQLDTMGFVFDAAELHDLRMTIRLIPYWSLVIPLTLLSAYLILWKPRKRKGPDHA